MATAGGDPAFAQVPANGISRQPSHKRRQPHTMNDGGYPPKASQSARARSVSYRHGPPATTQDSETPRSFSARAKDLLPDADLYGMDKPFSPEPPTPQDEEFSANQTHAQETHSPRNAQQASLNRSNTVRSASTSDQRHDWASDRSPLQKLEVTLNGISKEEKRARVLEAEMKLKERLAREKRENEARAAVSPQSAQAPGHQTRTPREQTTRESPMTTRESGMYASEKAPRTRNRAPSMQQGAVVAPNDNRTGTQTMKTGSAPRRSVSVSHRAGATINAGEIPAQTTGARNMPAQQTSLHSGAQSRLVSKDVGRKVPPQAAVVDMDLKLNPTMPNHNKPRAIQLHDAPMESLSDTDEPLSQSTKPKKPVVSFNVPPPTPPPLSEWKTAPIARLGASDFEFQTIDVDRSKAWWEGGSRNDRRRSRALPKNYEKPAAQKAAGNKRFQPQIFLKCGPLLRYAGLKRVRIDGPHGPFDKETWRGSILIVTKDSLSTYDPAPTLRLFSQPMDLLPPPPAELSGEDAQLAPEYIDPAAGLMKLGRDGRPLYVKPVEHTEEELDLSFIENDDGIYEMSASIVDYTSEGLKQPIPANRIHPVDGESATVYKEIPGARLYADPGRDVTFWRFNIEVELGAKQQRIAYRLNQGPALGFWVPARAQSMNIMFHTCNGFSPNVDTDKFCGPDPLWRDILNEHQTRPFHVMLGGGDQIFNDSITAESFHFQDWIRIKNVQERYDAPFTAEFKGELESRFLDHYSSWFSQGLFSLANSQIPMVNMWNDHEILEGFGSYPDEFMGTPVISGLGEIAFKYYLLFQHHSVLEETDTEEPSWLLGAQPGPYINQRSRNLFMSLGDGVVLLGLDCRTERMSDEILSEQTCDLIWDRCHREIVKGETKHLIVLLSIPIAYPRVAMVKNILNSRKTLGKAGLFGSFVNKAGGKVEIHDDHWTAKHHKSERTYLIEDLQDLAADKSVRVTILSGDVHLAAIGEFYSNAKLNIPKDKDYRYMPNIIASGIADMPETEMISDTLNRRNQVHHLDTNTDEDMIPIFTHDVNNKPRNNKRLLPRRNWCSIREYQPGSTPFGTPETESPPTPAQQPRPGKLQRTLSLNRGDRPQSSSGEGSHGGGLFRRLSLRGKPPTKDPNIAIQPPQRRMSMDGPFPPTETGDSYFPPSPDADFRPGPFHRRQSLKASGQKVSKRGDNGVGTFVDLEGGLAITLNLELNPKDPAGITTPYKLLVPMLRYDGTEYDPPASPVTKGWRKWLGVKKGGNRKKEKQEAEEEEEDLDDEEGLTDEEVER